MRIFWKNKNCKNRLMLPSFAPRLPRLLMPGFLLLGCLIFCNSHKTDSPITQITIAALHILKIKAFESRENKTVDFDTWVKSSAMFFYWSLVEELETNTLTFIKSIRTRKLESVCKMFKTPMSLVFRFKPPSICIHGGQQCIFEILKFWIKVPLI